MDKTSTLHCKVPREVKALIVAAATARGVRETGLPGKLEPWVIDTLTRSALEELDYPTLEDWIASKK